MYVVIKLTIKNICCKISFSLKRKFPFLWKWAESEEPLILPKVPSENKKSFEILSLSYSFGIAVQENQINLSSFTNIGYWVILYWDIWICLFDRSQSWRGGKEEEFLGFLETSRKRFGELPQRGRNKERIKKVGTEEETKLGRQVFWVFIYFLNIILIN